jgi:hypothetical protein
MHIKQLPLAPVLSKDSSDGAPSFGLCITFPKYDTLAVWVDALEYVATR